MTTHDPLEGWKIVVVSLLGIARVLAACAFLVWALIAACHKEWAMATFALLACGYAGGRD